MSDWPLTQLTLECFPAVPDHISLPWDAADAYVYQHVDLTTNTLLINDRHGALACLFGQHQSWCDSASAIVARQQNLASNFPEQIFAPAQSSPKTIDWQNVQQVVIRIPKNFDQLKYWLFYCQQNLSQDIPIYLAGMAKHIPVSWLNWLEQQSQNYQQFRIEKKARLLQLHGVQINTPQTTGYQHQALILNAVAGVFSGNKLDIGSRVILPYLELIQKGTVCDLGCGNGLLGLSIKQQQPECQLILTDDSYVAAQSARQNAQRNGLDIEVRHGNCLSAVNEPLDWVVCNPPYHDGHKELTNIAINMFRESQQKLSNEGQMLIIANRHLPYQKTLNRLFKRVNNIHKDAKFTVFHCQFPKR